MNLVQSYNPLSSASSASGPNSAINAKDDREKGGSDISFSLILNQTSGSADAVLFLCLCVCERENLGETCLYKKNDELLVSFRLCSSNHAVHVSPRLILFPPPP